MKEWGAQLSDVVFVGDSATDLECLVDVGVGILIVTEGQKRSRLLMTLERIAVRVVHISEFGRRRETDEKCLFWARDFEDIIESGIVDS